MSINAELDYTPARVHIVADDTKTVQLERKVFTDSVPHTYLSSAIPQLILPRTTDRTQANIMILGVLPTNSFIILTDSEADASAAAIYYATELGGGGGAMMQPGMAIQINHDDEVWMVAVGTGTPPLVSVIGEYERR